MESGFRLRELFHLLALRQLSGRLASRPYAVKGGIGLRFFHRSPRLSEDMDLDITPEIPLQTLQKNVDAVLEGGALAASLYSSGVRQIEVSRPKQTATTQRWKIGLILSGGSRLSSCIEFSRRGVPEQSQRGTPGAEILQEASLPPFAVSYYGAAAIVRQKISALASATRTAARDLFDLHHLLFVIQTPDDKIVTGLDPEDLNLAIEKVGRFEFSDFRDQVLPFLPGDLAGLYGNAASFREVRQQVENRLTGYLP